MSSEPEIVEYEPASIVGLKYEYYGGDIAYSSVEHVINQYKLNDNLNKSLDEIACEYNAFDQRYKLDYYLLVNDEYMLYGIDYNSGFFIPNDWDLISTDGGMYSRVNIKNNEMDDHTKYVDTAIEFALGSGFVIDDAHRQIG